MSIPDANNILIASKTGVAECDIMAEFVHKRSSADDYVVAAVREQPPSAIADEYVVAAGRERGACATSNGGISGASCETGECLITVGRVVAAGGVAVERLRTVGRVGKTTGGQAEERIEALRSIVPGIAPAWWWR